MSLAFIRSSILLHPCPCPLELCDTWIKPERHALFVVEKQSNQCCMLVERLTPLCITRTKPIMLESRDNGGNCREIQVGVVSGKIYYIMIAGTSTLALMLL